MKHECFLTTKQSNLVIKNDDASYNDCNWLRVITRLVKSIMICSCTYKCFGKVGWDQIIWINIYKDTVSMFT